MEKRGKQKDDRVVVKPIDDPLPNSSVKARLRAKWSRPATVLVRAGGGAGYKERTFPSLAELGNESS